MMVGYLRRRAGHTEAGCDLAKLAGLSTGISNLRNHERRRVDGTQARPGKIRPGA